MVLRGDRRRRGVNPIRRATMRSYGRRWRTSVPHPTGATLHPTSGALRACGAPAPYNFQTLGRPRRRRETTARLKRALPEVASRTPCRPPEPSSENEASVQTDREDEQTASNQPKGSANCRARLSVSGSQPLVTPSGFALLVHQRALTAARSTAFVCSILTQCPGIQGSRRRRSRRSPRPPARSIHRAFSGPAVALVQSPREAGVQHALVDALPAPSCAPNRR